MDIVNLVCHPSTVSTATRGVSVEISANRSGQLRLRYAIVGELSRIVLPVVQTSARQDELWRHTCCEAFIGAPDVSAASDYYEFNFAPTTAWAAYSFTGYRAGMTPIHITAPHISVERTDDAYYLHVLLNLHELAAMRSTMRVGLSCVIEADDGRVSYWALAHPPGKPDFHHRSGFILNLARE